MTPPAKAGTRADPSAKRLINIERELAEIRLKLDQYVADNEKGREILAAMNDRYCQDRIWKWFRIAAFGAAATYQQWSPLFWKLVGGTHGS